MDAKLVVNIDRSPDYFCLAGLQGNDQDIPFLNIHVDLQLILNVGLDVANFMPNEYMLFQNFPNLFNPTTMIQYYVPEGCMVEIKNFNFVRNEIKTLVRERQVKQFYRVHWDGTNSNGVPMPSGMYFFRMFAKSA